MQHEIIMYLTWFAYFIIVYRLLVVEVIYFINLNLGSCSN